MAREFLLRGVDPEELLPPPKPEAPKTPRGKWDNFWYHYKWHFWGGLFTVVVLVVLVVQMLQRNPADYEFLLVTDRAMLDAHIEVLEKELAAHGEDLDGDGEIEVHIQNCYLSNPGTQQYYTNQQVLQTRIFAGDVMLFMWEPKYYTEFMKNITGDSQEEVRFLAQLPFSGEAVIEDGTVYKWDTAELRKKPLMENLPKELYCGVRDAVGTASSKVEMRDTCIKLLTGIFSSDGASTEE